MNSSLWTTADRSGYFLIADDRAPEPGSLAIRRLDGKTAMASPAWLAAFAITEEQARRVARHQLGDTLDELKTGIDARLAGLRTQLDERKRAPEAGSALFDFLKTLPGVIANSLAQDADRVEAATTTMAGLQRRLKEAGIDVDQRFAAFPGRLAALREDLRKPKP